MSGQIVTATQEEFISWYVDSQKVKFQDPVSLFTLRELPEILFREILAKLPEILRSFMIENNKIIEILEENPSIFCGKIITALEEKYLKISTEISEKEIET